MDLTAYSWTGCAIRVGEEESIFGDRLESLGWVEPWYLVSHEIPKYDVEHVLGGTQAGRPQRLPHVNGGPTAGPLRWLCPPDAKTPPGQRTTP